MTMFWRNRSRFPVRFRQRNKFTLDDVEFLLTAEGALLGPSLLFCVVIGQPWPLFLMAATQLLGVILGTANFNKSLDSFLSCVPSTSTLNRRKDDSARNWKKAA